MSASSQPVDTKKETHPFLASTAVVKKHLPADANLQNAQPLSDTKLNTDAKSAFTSEKSIQKIINLIWLGSEMRLNHVFRVDQWKKLNPDYTVIVWTDIEFQKKIREQLSLCKYPVNTNLVEELKLPATVKQWVTMIVEPRTDALPPNYAAASDIYRFYFDEPGWYVDTDTTPQCLDNYRANSNFNFCFYGTRTKTSTECDLAPSVIASGKESLLVKNARSFLELMSVACANEASTRLIRSKLASVRRWATLISTGYTLECALKKILIDEVPLIDLVSGRKTQHPAVFDSLTVPWGGNFEHSWILDELSLAPHEAKPFVSTHQKSLKSCPGIQLDQDFLDTLLLGTISDEIKKAIMPLLVIRSEMSRQINPSTVTLKVIPESAATVAQPKAP